MTANPREQKTPTPTVEQMVVLLRYRLSEEQWAALVVMLQCRRSRDKLIRGLILT